MKRYYFGRVTCSARAGSLTDNGPRTALSVFGRLLKVELPGLAGQEVILQQEVPTAKGD